MRKQKNAVHPTCASSSARSALRYYSLITLAATLHVDLHFLRHPSFAANLYQVLTVVTRVVLNSYSNACLEIRYDLVSTIAAELTANAPWVIVIYDES